MQAAQQGQLRRSLPNPPEADSQFYQRFNNEVLALEEAEKKKKNAGLILRGVPCQEHHVLSNKIMAALERHSVLKGEFERDDLDFLVWAMGPGFHRGYQRWHRAYDNLVTDWLAVRRDATRDEFLDFLDDIYAKPSMRERFGVWKSRR